MMKLNRSKQFTRIAAVLSASALMLTACGGGDSSDVAAPDTPADATATAPGAPPADVPGQVPLTNGQVPAAGQSAAPALPGAEATAGAPGAAAAPGTGGKPAGSKKPSGTTGEGQGQAPAGAGGVPAAPITTGTVTVDLGAGKTVRYDATKPIKMVWFNFGSGYTYTEAITKGAMERAKQLGVQLDVKDAQVNPATQVQQMQSAITSRQYVGGFVLPISQDILCDVGTRLAPENNFMLVVTNAPICGRVPNEGMATWAPGTLAFDSADQEISDWTAWGDYIRTKNPGKQKVILLVGLPTTGQSENADDAMRALQKQHPEFEIVDTVYTDFTQSAANTAMNAALLRHPDTTVVASIYSELTKATVDVLQSQGKTGKVKVYDVGADSTILPLIQSGRVEMTRPYYPVTMGATAVQAIYDARVGRQPIVRFYDSSGHARPALQGTAPFLAVTRENLEQFRKANLSEY
jgi:ribose transport system substrate-binding protein